MGLGVPPPAQLLSIRSGVGGVTDTLKVMAQLARQYKVHPLLVQTANRIIAGCAGRDQVCELEQLQNWVRNRIRYAADPVDVEKVQTPDYTLQEGYGDCDDQSVLLATFLLAIGIPAAFCALGVNGGPYSHVLPVAILRQHTQVLYVPCETTLSADPYTGEPIGPGWFPSDVTCQKWYHI